MSHVTVRDLWMEYPGQVVLERVNLEIPSGSFNVLIGPSGCGKTTFLRLLLSMEQPTRGSIQLDGEALPPEPGPDRGIVFQRYSVFPHLTVVQNVILGLEFALVHRMGDHGDEGGAYRQLTGDAQPRQDPGIDVRATERHTPP